MTGDSLVALHAALVLIGALAALAWLRGRPRLAPFLLAIGGLLGLSYWLLQIKLPLGLGTEVAPTRAWAQAGVNASLLSGRMGFVYDTRPEPSRIAAFAAAGIPVELLHLLPQIATVLCFVMGALAPWAFIRRRTTAAFAACLVMGGSLWPGAPGLDAVLTRPSSALTLAAALALAAMLSRVRAVSTFVADHRGRLATTLIAAAALDRAWRGGVNLGPLAAGLLVAATLLLASLLRAAIRAVSPSPTAAKQLEAAAILGLFCGSGLFWWNPPLGVPGFEGSLDRGGALEKPLRWIAQNSAADAVILASPSYSAPIAALAGRRVLFPPLIETGPSPFRGSARRGQLLASALAGRPIERLAKAFGVTHLFLGPGEPITMADEGGLGDEGSRLDLVLVYRDAEEFRVFRLVKK